MEIPSTSFNKLNGVQKAGSCLPKLICSSGPRQPDGDAGGADETGVIQSLQGKENIPDLVPDSFSWLTVPQLRQEAGGVFSGELDRKGSPGYG